MGRIRQIMLTLLCGFLDAMAGRLLSDWRRRDRDSNMAVDATDGIVDALRVGPRELVPGLVAAMRVGEPPWSFLRIPPWLAAFAVNFAFGAAGRELHPFFQRFTGTRERPAPARWEPPSSTHDVVVESGATGAPIESTQPPGAPELSPPER